MNHIRAEIAPAPQEPANPRPETGVDTADESQREVFGRQLRKLRQDRGMTLAECSRLTGLAISTLSKAERGLMALTYDRLMQLATGLGVDMSALFGAKGASFQPGSVAVARLGEFQLQETPTYTYEILFPEVWSKAMTPMSGVVKARSRNDFADFIRHSGQEFVFVQSGQLTIHFEGREPITLAAGESLYFDSGIGHIYTSTSEDEARVLVVCLGDPIQSGGL